MANNMDGLSFIEKLSFNAFSVGTRLPHSMTMHRRPFGVAEKKVLSAKRTGQGACDGDGRALRDAKRAFAMRRIKARRKATGTENMHMKGASGRTAPGSKASDETKTGRGSPESMIERLYNDEFDAAARETF